MKVGQDKRENMKRVLYIISLLFVFISCQKEEDPLTIEDINEINNVNSSKFSAIINEGNFKTNNAEGIKINGQLTITSTDNKKTIVVNVSGIEEGIYLGKDNNFKNYVNFLDAGGTLFSSTKQGVDSDLRIEITNFNEAKSTVSGTVSGTLHAPWDEKILIRNGRFSGVSVETPFTGNMKADIGPVKFRSESCIFSSASSSGFTIETIASSANNDSLQISFTIEENIIEKTYNLATAPITARYNSNVFSTDVFKHQYTSSRGVLTISSIDTVEKVVKGSFNFDAVNFLSETIQVKSGEFNAAIR